MIPQKVVWSNATIEATLPDARRRLTQAGLWLAWGMAVVAALVLWNLSSVLLMLGQTPTNVAFASQFLLVLPLAASGCVA